MTEKEVRVRIAPSPTGDPHVGTAYTTLFNYVFAKQNAGKLVFRLEDTDQKRSKSSSEQQLSEYLSWLNLRWDEGPDVGGDYGPYRQSERLEIYDTYIKKLIEENKAYPCFCTAERLAEVRKEQKGAITGYDRHCRDLCPDEAAKRIASGETHVYRMKMPLEGKTTYVDELRGEISFDNSQIDDQVLLKADRFPTYHFANVVDDYLMKISHVIRAEEWLSSTPKHVVLYKQFGWDLPKFIHLPLLRNQDKSKISKRKNPVSIAFYKRSGILPKALVNFLSLMGWRPKDEQEIFDMDKMIAEFDFKNMSLGGPVFDQVKLNWVNQNYIKSLSDDEVVDYLHENVFSKEYLKKIVPLSSERISRFDQFTDKMDFFFNGELDYTGLEILPKDLEKKVFLKGLKEILEALDNLYDWNADAIGELIGSFKDKLGWKPKHLFLPIRMITTGRKDSPPLNECLDVLGREIVRYRIRDFMEKHK